MITVAIPLGALIIANAINPEYIAGLGVGTIPIFAFFGAIDLAIVTSFLKKGK
jgi:hypothetical protein